MPGGEVAQLRDSPPFAALVINAGLAAQGLLQQGTTTLYEQFFRDAQTVIDAGDPINNFIALATTSHPIHLIQVVGSATPPPAVVCLTQPTPSGCLTRWCRIPPRSA